jgi:rubrerythrin
MTVTLNEVNEYISKETARRNGKVIRKLPGALREMTQNPYWYVFNVGPWEFTRQLGGNGTKTLAGCPEDEKYSIPTTFPIIHNETVATDMNAMENVQEEGQVHLNAFMIEGYGCKPEDSLRYWGVEAIDHWPPTAQDLIAPNKRLNAKLDDLISEGDRYHENREHQNITDRHRWAARKRKQMRGWLNENPELVSCRACGSMVMPSIAVCPHCSAVLDEKLARQFFPERFQKAS